jgi:hypothetical protein
MRTEAYYEVELTFADEPDEGVRLTSQSEEEVLSIAHKAFKPGAELFVACLGPGVDLGNFILIVDGQGKNEVQCHEHRGFLARGLDREQVLNALRRWLPNQERDPEVQWEDA